MHSRSLPFPPPLIAAVDLFPGSALLLLESDEVLTLQRTLRGEDAIMGASLHGMTIVVPAPTRATGMQGFARPERPRHFGGATGHAAAGVGAASDAFGMSTAAASAPQIREELQQAQDQQPLLTVASFLDTSDVVARAIAAGMVQQQQLQQQQKPAAGAAASGAGGNAGDRARRAGEGASGSLSGAMGGGEAGHGTGLGFGGDSTASISLSGNPSTSLYGMRDAPLMGRLGSVASGLAAMMGGGAQGAGAAGLQGQIGGSSSSSSSSSSSASASAAAAAAAGAGGGGDNVALLQQQQPKSLIALSFALSFGSTMPSMLAIDNTLSGTRAGRVAASSARLSMPLPYLGSIPQSASVASVSAHAHLASAIGLGPFTNVPVMAALVAAAGTGQHLLGSVAQLTETRAAMQLPPGAGLKSLRMTDTYIGPNLLQSTPALVHLTPPLFTSVASVQECSVFPVPSPTLVLSTPTGASSDLSSGYASSLSL